VTVFEPIHGTLLREHPFQGAVGILARTPGFAVALGARDVLAHL
jgi:hypothetical protein